MVKKRLDADAVVIGAGVAGCAAAIAVRRRGFRVLLLEKSVAPDARFCGEFVSGEALGSLMQLGVGGILNSLEANPVSRLELHSPGGRCLAMPLPAGGFGLSRRALDSALLSQACREGVQLFSGVRVTAVSGGPTQGYRIEGSMDGDQTQIFSARAIIGAQGKRSSLDRLLGRDLFDNHSEWIGVRRHYHGADSSDAVALYLFPGGYCGAVSVDRGLTTLALLSTRRALKQCGDRPENLIERARTFNAALGRRLDAALAVPGSVRTISRISFASREKVVRGVFMVGDGAGVTAPFLGIGVANALGSALAGAASVARWLDGSDGFDQARAGYEDWFRSSSSVRLAARVASRVLCHAALGDTGIRFLMRHPGPAISLYHKSRVVTRPQDRLPDPPEAAAGAEALAAGMSVAAKAKANSRAAAAR